MKPEILYIENIAEDRSAFEKQMEQQFFFNFTVVKEISNLVDKLKFDIIICNENNDSYLEAIKMFYPKQIIVVCNSNFNKKDSFFIKKPFSIKKLFNSIYTLNDTKINEMAKGNKIFFKEIILIIKNELTVSIQKIIEAVENKDAEKIKFATHKINAELNFLKLPCLNEFNFIEKNATAFDTSEFLIAFHKAKSIVFVALYHLNNKLAAL